MRTSASDARTGFSLVELSIVLVILGLLVGGVLTGRALIRASELRSITTEAERYAGAINAFREKHFFQPGDLPNAFQFWGAACGTNDTTPSTGCNGNGNGSIDIGSSTGCTTCNFENVRAWEHLARAGLVAGSYDGTGTVNSVATELSSGNIPASRFPRGYWNVGDSPTEGLNFEETLNGGGGLFLSLGSLDPIYTL